MERDPFAGHNNPCFPERSGRIKPEIPTVLEVATIAIDKAGKLILDPVVHKSVGSMDGRE